jgi:hypothetical protein
MIVVDEGDSLLLITQPDHAHLAAEILSLCRFPGLVEHPRRKAILRATREHDNGWQELDAAPPVDAAGRPRSFAELPDGMRRELWTRAVERFRQADPYVALLILRHSLETNSDRSGDAWVSWTETATELQTELLDEIDVEQASLDTDYAFLRFADLCSLAICTHAGEPFEHLGVRGRPQGTTLRLDPSPLAGTTSFTISCRQIPKRVYPSTVALGLELTTAHWQTRAVRVAAFED